MKKIVIIFSIFIASSSFSQKTDEVFSLIDKYPFRFPELIKRQYLLESAHGKSDVFLKNKNCFGMRRAGQRRTNALGSRKGYAVYRNTQSSIVERFNYDMKYMSKLTKKEYLMYLNKVYSDGSGKYVKGLTKINLKTYE